MSKKKFAKRQVGAAVSATVPSKQKEHPASGINSQTNWFVLILFILPFVVSREAIDATITIRYLILSIFMAAFVLYFYVFRKEPLQLELTLIVRAVFIFGLAFSLWSLVSIFNSINRSAGYYEWLRYLLNLSLLFLVMQMVSKEGFQIMRIFKVLVVVGLLHSFIGIFQYYELAFNELPGANEKPYGLMANRNLFGSAQVLLIPFIIYVGVKVQGLWRAIALTSGLLTILSIILSQTRSAWVAAFVIGFISLILVLIYLPSFRKRWAMGTAVSLGAALVLAFLLTLNDSEGDLSRSISERATSFTSRLDSSTQSSNNVQERFKVWRKTTQLIEDKPIIGTGLANWKLSIAQYGTQGLAWASGYYVPDSPHNLYLQLASETGIPGAILYIAVFALIAVAGLKMMRRLTEDEKLLTILMLAGIVAFASDSMFSFPADRIEHSFYLTLMAGIILGLSLAPADQTVRPIRSINKVAYLLLLIAAANVFFAIQKHRFEVHLNYAKGYEKAGRYQEMIEETKKGKNGFVNIDMVGTSLEAKASVAYNELKDYPQALKESQRALKHHPHSPMVFNNMGIVYTNMGEFARAIECYNKALLYAPDYEIVLKNLAVNYFKVGNYQACIDALRKVKDDGDPYLAELMATAQQMAIDSTKKQ